MRRLFHSINSDKLQAGDTVMIYSLKGELLLLEPNMIVISCGGVGFKCTVTQNTVGRMPQIGQEVKVYTHLNVREDAIELYGFYSAEEMTCFKQLISVSGVGPKAAIAILSVMSPESFAMAVASNDSKLITKAQGVGAKTAQRICLELKDKLSFDMSSPADSFGISSVSGNVPASSNASQAVDALVVLGFNKSEASSIVGRLDSSLPVDQLIKQALKESSRLG